VIGWQVIEQLIEQLIDACQTMMSLNEHFARFC